MPTPASALSPERVATIVDAAERYAADIIGRIPPRPGITPDEWGDWMKTQHESLFALAHDLPRDAALRVVDALEAALQSVARSGWL